MTLQWSEAARCCLLCGGFAAAASTEAFAGNAVGFCADALMCDTGFVALAVLLHEVIEGAAATIAVKHSDCSWRGNVTSAPCGVSITSHAAQKNCGLAAAFPADC